MNKQRKEGWLYISIIIKLKSIFILKRGSVTTFILILLPAIIIFEQALYIISVNLIYRHQVDQFIESVIRSIHSKYSIPLSNYGLFGVEEVTKQKKYIEDLLKIKQNTDKTNLQLTMFKPAGYLNEPNVFKEQVNEEMRLIAPIEWTKLLSEKIRGNINATNIDKTQNILNQYKWISNKLIEYESNATKLNEFLINFYIRDKYLSAELKLIRQSVDNLENNTNYRDFLVDWNANIQKIIYISEYTDSKLKDIIINIDNFVDFHNKLTKKLDEFGVLGDFEGLLYKDNYFSELKMELSRFKSITLGSFQIIQHVKQLLGADILKNKIEFIESIKLAENTINNISSYQNDMYSNLKSKLSAINLETTNVSDSFSEQLIKLKKILFNCDGYNVNYNELNESTPSLAEIEIPQYTSTIFDQLDKMGEKLYLAEFALQKFNFRTFITSDDSSFKQPHKFHNYEIEKIIFNKDSCQLNQSRTTVEIFMLRFAINLVQELTNINNLSPSAFVQLTKIIGTAIGNAFNETKSIVEGKNIPFIKSVTLVNFNYSDYLRIFIFLLTPSESIIVRSQQLIELNTNMKLANVSTQLSTSIKYRKIKSKMYEKWKIDRGGIDTHFSY